jgi:hypothetical protein
VEAGGHPGDVRAGAAGHGAPLRGAEDAEHAVVLEEGEEVARGVVERRGRVARPHGGDERLHEVAHEARREAARGQEVAQGLVAGVLGSAEHGARPAVEPRDLQQHPPVLARAQRGPLGEEPARPESPGVLDAGAGVAHRQRHLRGLRLDAELGEESQEGRVGAPVVDDEAGVDGELAAGRRDPVRVGVTAEAVVGLVDRDVRGAGGDPGSGQARDAGADDGDPALLVPGAAGGVHVASVRSNRAMGSVVGCFEPPSGSTVMPTATASAAEPSSTTVWSAASGMRPAATNSSSGDMNHSS